MLNFTDNGTVILLSAVKGCRLELIKEGLNRWRKGLGSMPEDYIKLHQECAEDDLERFLKVHELTLVKTEMVSDGWADGMKVLRVIADNKFGTVEDFRWSDSNGGSWYRRHLTGGASLVESAPNGPGYL